MALIEDIVKMCLIHQYNHVTHLCFQNGPEIHERKIRV